MAFFGLSFDFLFNQLRNGSNGSLAGGSVTFYAAGTTTPKAVWTDRAMTMPSVAGVLTPYPLTADGTATLYGAGVYKVVVKNASGVTVFTYDDFECTSPTVTDNIADTLVNVVSLTSPAQAQIDTKLTKVVTSSTSTGTFANAGTYTYLGATDSATGKNSSFQSSAAGTIAISSTNGVTIEGGTGGVTLQGTVEVNSTVASIQADTLDIASDTRVSLNVYATAPASSTAAGMQGEIRTDTNYIYRGTGTNTWKRIPMGQILSTATGATHVVDSTMSGVIANRAGTVTLSLQSASLWPGATLMVKTIQSQLVVSAASDVVPITGGAAGTAILAATAGKWATLVSNGTNWEIMASN